jgi:hypothetical protein
MIKRLCLFLVLVVGVVLFAFPFVTGLWGKTQSVEKLTGDFRSTFTDKTLAQTRTDFDGVVKMADQLTKQTLPALPPLLDMTSGEFSTALATNFPDVTTGVTALPRILPRLETLVSGLESEQADFKKADSIPTSWLPSTSLPWILVVFGGLLALVALGAIGGKVPAASAAGLTVIVGVVLVGVALFCQIHVKGEAVDRLTTTLKPFFTADGAAQTRQDMDAVQAMADQLQNDTLPFLATNLKMTPAQLNDFLAKNFPDVATGVASLDTVLPRFQADVTAISDNVKSFKDASNIPGDIPVVGDQPTSSVFWWLVLPGVALILVGIIALWPAKE